MGSQLEEYVDMFPIHPAYIDTFQHIVTVEKREVLKTIHYGSAMFTLAEKDHLQGTYFTDRKTTGDLDFTKVN